jgi:two-component system phosphate regulon sensor histidine kinase PhoR
MQTNDVSETNKVKKYSKIIFDENQRMRKLVDKVLNIATFDKGLVTLEKENIDIHDIICKVGSNFCLETNLADIKINYLLNAKNFHVYADPLHLRNIISNLIDNAIKYSQNAPEITITTENKNDTVIIAVSDKGKGIAKDAQKKVFDKFYRVPSGDIHNVKGFGLGLFYVKTMTEAINGKVEIISALNKGTTIRLTIPQLK